MKKENAEKDAANIKPQDPFDPLGSYTGKPADPHDKPQQDADDL